MKRVPLKTQLKSCDSFPPLDEIKAQEFGKVDLSLANWLAVKGTLYVGLRNARLHGVPSRARVVHATQAIDDLLVARGFITPRQVELSLRNELGAGCTTALHRIAARHLREQLLNPQQLKAKTVSRA